ncbi:alpha/beta fold hydrolase [Pelomonas sp. SE-A7]|uniref:alpha/beta fold hydrolase n=1 Tax=Pelomonas sp. SE-A7 TaxID=3054953 RepID=UPI00259C7AD5|nr:alpha/beta fold hydrolase [Pelomonas sp. SE-A7]MDM4767841.1 alpha/beta fold hydrolase [Pelomonas sp. SE-A7]
MPIETFALDLPHGITLSCRAAGDAALPRLVFLHGFPEGAFVWDELMEKLADRFRCIAPNLRGYEKSSSPAEVEAYRAKHLMADIAALVAATGEGPLAALVAHDWGGAVAWNLAVQQPQLMQRLVILNSPHPGTFLRELQQSEAQRQSSAYMNELCEPGMEEHLAANDFARLWPFFTDHGGQPWLDEALKQRYRELWSHGLRGPINYYRASPMRPPRPGDPGAMALQFPDEFITVRLPTLVIWGLDDRALPPGLIDGLERYVPRLELLRLPTAGHWLVHEQPDFIAEQLLRVCQ